MPSSNFSKKYILDTNIIRPLFDYYYPPELFPEIWNGLDRLEKLGLLTSVRAVKTECDLHFRSNPDALSWLKKHSKLFQMPTDEEQDFMRVISSNNEFKMSDEEIMKGKTEADPLLVAKGKCTGDIVVTAEKYKPHGRKIPKMCEYYNVQCIGRVDFIRILRELDSLPDK